MKIKFFLALTLVVSGLSSVSQGGLIDSSASLTGTIQTNTPTTSPFVDRGFITNVDLFPTSGNSIAITGTLSTPNMFLGRTTGWFLNGNGKWTGPGPNGVAFDGVDADGDVLTLTPSTAVSGFVLSLGHATNGSDGAVLKAFNGVTLLETYTFTIDIDGSANEFKDRGIERGTNEITSFTLHGDYPAFAYLYVGQQAGGAIPEPSTFSMLAFCGIAMAGYSRLRRRRK